MAFYAVKEGLSVEVAEHVSCAVLVHLHCIASHADYASHAACHTRRCQTV